MGFNWFERMVVDPKLLSPPESSAEKPVEAQDASAVTDSGGRHVHIPVTSAIASAAATVPVMVQTTSDRHEDEHHEHHRLHMFDRFHHRDSDLPSTVPSHSPTAAMLRAPPPDEMIDLEGSYPGHGFRGRIRYGCHRLHLRASRWLAEFNSPDGVTKEHRGYVRFFGQIGFVAKGVVYGIIGGLTVATAVHAPSPNGSENNASPQGAFLLLGSSKAVGLPLLITMAVGLLFYIIWRFWEASTGQGADRSFSSLKNFFKYRLSPFVSGCVYTAYLMYIIFVAIKNRVENKDSSSYSGCFPSCWNESVIGRVGLGFVAVAFLIATLTQLGPGITGSFKYDLRLSICRRWVRILLRTLGHIGFLARAGVFLCVAVLFIRSIDNDVDQLHFTVGASINQLSTTSAGRFCLWILGLGLVVYGLFAVSNSYFKYFPTKPRNEAFPYNQDRHQHRHFKFRRYHKHKEECPRTDDTIMSPSIKGEPCPDCHAPPLAEPITVDGFEVEPITPPATHSGAELHPMDTAVAVTPQPSTQTQPSKPVPYYYGQL